MKSSPARGTWIEINVNNNRYQIPACRSPRGGRGLKLLAYVAVDLRCRRSPRGGCGLKLADGIRIDRKGDVVPREGDVD